MDLTLVLEVPPTTDSPSVHVSGFVPGRPDLEDFDGSLSATGLVGVLSSIFGRETVEMLQRMAAEESPSPSAGDSVRPPDPAGGDPY